MIRLFIAFILLGLIFFITLILGKVAKQFQDKFMAISGIVIPIIALFFLTSTLTDITAGVASSADWLVFLFSLAALAIGIKLFIENFKGEKRKSVKEIEKQILAVVETLGGRVTPIEIAMKTELTVEEAEGKLNHFCDHKISEMNVTPKGKIVYIFPGLITEEEKNQAKHPMDL